MPVGVLTYSSTCLRSVRLQIGRSRSLSPSKSAVAREPRELRAEALQVAEGELVDDADQAVELQERVLKRRRREQHLLKGRDGLLDGLAILLWLVDVPQPVRFVDDDQIPGVCRT